MSVLQILGIAIIAIPFVAMFAYMAYEAGLAAAIFVYAMTVAVFVVVGAGVLLACGGSCD